MTSTTAETRHPASGFVAILGWAAVSATFWWGVAKLAGVI